MSQAESAETETGRAEERARRQREREERTKEDRKQESKERSKEASTQARKQGENKEQVNENREILRHAHYALFVAFFEQLLDECGLLFNQPCGLQVQRMR
jgi:hypothetical protein